MSHNSSVVFIALDLAMGGKLAQNEVTLAHCGHNMLLKQIKRITISL